MNAAMADGFDGLSVECMPGGLVGCVTTSVTKVQESQSQTFSEDVAAGQAEMVLVEAIKRGEEQAFMDLVERFHSPLLRVAMTFVHCEAVAEEVVQDTWLAVLEGIHRFEGRSSLKTWIFRILMNRAKTQGVRESRYVEFPRQTSTLDHKGSDIPDDAGLALGGEAWPGECVNKISSQTATLPDQQLLNQELVQRITAAIHRLPLMQRKVILLRDVEGFESEEVCRMLNLSDTNQRVLLHRARTKVREALAPYIGEIQSTPHFSKPCVLKPCA